MVRDCSRAETINQSVFFFFCFQKSENTAEFMVNGWVGNETLPDIIPVFVLTLAHPASFLRFALLPILLIYFTLSYLILRQITGIPSFFRNITEIPRF